MASLGTPKWGTSTGWPVQCLLEDGVTVGPGTSKGCPAPVVN